MQVHSTHYWQSCMHVTQRSYKAMSSGSNNYTSHTCTQHGLPLTPASSWVVRKCKLVPLQQLDECNICAANHVARLNSLCFVSNQSTDTKRWCLITWPLSRLKPAATPDFPLALVAFCCNSVACLLLKFSCDKNSLVNCGRVVCRVTYD